MTAPVFTVAYCFRVLLLLLGVLCVPLLLLHVAYDDDDLLPRKHLLLQKGSLPQSTLKTLMDTRPSGRKKKTNEHVVEKIWRSLSSSLSATGNSNASMAEAWPPTASRNLSVYIRPREKTALLLPPSSRCTPWLLILVHSSTAGYQARMAIRNTWALWARHGDYIEIRFVIGRAADSGITRALQMESEVYRDIVQEDFLDVYSNLTLKSIFGLKWALNNCKAQFTMKCDEDVFVHLPNLVDFLAYQGKPMSIMGIYTVNSPVIRYPGSKYYAPIYMYQSEVYPRYASGTAYVLHHEAAAAVFRRAFHVPLLHLEDVFVTGILATSVSVVPVHSNRFVRHWRSFESLHIPNDSSYNVIPSTAISSSSLSNSSSLSSANSGPITDPLPNVCSLLRLLTCHSVTPSQMVAIWQRLQDPTVASECVPCWMTPWADHCFTTGSHRDILYILVVVLLFIWFFRVL